jgi:AraC-like DNA-binding protein
MIPCTAQYNVMNQRVAMIGKTRQTQEKVQVEEVFDVDLGRARGILRWPPPAGQFKHLRRRPPVDLTPWIESYWMVTWDLPQPFLQETLPHPNLYLVFEDAKCVIGGVSTGKFSRVLEGRSGVFGIKFRPGGLRPFMKSAAASLLNQTISARRIFGKDTDVLEAALVASSWKGDRMIDAADAFFRARLPKPDPTIELADRIVRRIFEESEIKTVDDLVDRTGIGKRKLQRIFNEYVGVSPKWVIRRYRLHELIEILNSDQQPDWPQLALELGYFDQAHLINDFRSIVGCPPSHYQRLVPKSL